MAFNRQKRQTGFKKKGFVQRQVFQAPQSDFRQNYEEQYVVKKSGAKHGVSKKDLHYVTAWNKSQSKGFVVVKAFQNKKSVFSESENGSKFIMMMFEITYRDTGNQLLELANFNLTTGKVYLEKLDMVISTKAPNGGYFGKAR